MRRRRLSSAGSDRVSQGKYRKLGALGKGGMAHVFLAVSSGPAGFNKLLVLKELKAELVDDPDFVKMFLDEARLCARLNHPNIVHTYDVLEGGGAPPTLVMEYLEGQALSTLIARASRGEGLGSLNLRAISEALAGLHYAHELADYDGTPLGLVHRDVSPQNIFVCYDGSVKLLDFGVAKVRGAMVQTATGVIKGKLGYMAPEVLMGKPIDRRADIFSVGVMIWEALARRRITRGRSDVEITGGRVSGNEGRLADIAPETPPRLIEICEKAMALNVAERYSTALELKRALDAELDASASVDRLGAICAELFAEERRQLAKTIEANLKQPAAEEPISLPQAKVEESSQPSDAGDPTTPAVMTPGGLTPSATELSAAPAPSRRPWLFVGAAALALVVIAIAVVALRAPPPATSEPSPPSAQPSPVAAPSAAALAPPPATPPPVESAAPAPSVAPEPAAPSRERRPGTVAVVKAPAASAPSAKPEGAMGSEIGKGKKVPRTIDENDPYAK